MFNVGDEVLCTSSRTGKFDGKIATIVDIFEESVYVQFKESRDPIEMFTWRFEHVDKDMKGLSPVCFKIRQMDKRWEKFQARKGVAI